MYIPKNITNICQIFFRLLQNATFVQNKFNMVKEATSLKLDKELFDRVKEQARNENRTMANFIETVLLNYLKELAKEKPESK